MSHGRSTRKHAAAALLALALVQLCASADALRVPQTAIESGAWRVLLSSTRAPPNTEAQDAHKPFVFNGRNGPAMALTFVVGALANAVGIGGGAFYVPLFNILLGFSLKGSTALSQAVITGGAIASVAISLASRHPLDPAKPLLDFDMALMLTCPLLLGVSVGVLLNTVLADWLITFLLTALLLLMTYRTLRKSWSLHQAEKRAAQQVAAAASIAISGQDGQDAPPADQPPRDVPSAGPSPIRTRSGRESAETDARTVRRRARSSTGAQPVDQPAGSAPGELGSDGQPAQGSETADRLQTSPSQQLTRPALREGHDAARRLSLSEERSDSLSLDQPAAALWGEDGSLVDVRIGIGDSISAELNGDGDPSQHRQKRVQPFDGVEMAAERASAEQEHTEAEPHTPSAVDPHGPEPSAPSRFPMVKIGEVLALWAVYVALQLVKTRYNRCAAPYFGIFGCQAVLAAATNALFTWQAKVAVEAEARRPIAQPMLARGPYTDPVWTLPTLIRCSVITLVGGAIAGLLGIGGGMIVSPLLLELGVHPLVAAATSSLMVLFSASSAALSFAFDKLLNIKYSLIYGIGCFGSSLIGVLLVTRAVRRSGKASALVLILAGVIGLGAVLTGVFGGRKAIEALEAGELGFQPFCSATGS